MNRNADEASRQYFFSSIPDDETRESLERGTVLDCHDSSLWNGTQARQVCRCFGSEKGCTLGSHCARRHDEPNSVRLCSHFQHGRCERGEQCTFRHSEFSASETSAMQLVARASPSSCQLPVGVCAAAQARAPRRRGRRRRGGRRCVHGRRRWRRPADGLSAPSPLVCAVR